MLFRFSKQAFADPCIVWKRDGEICDSKVGIF